MNEQKDTPKVGKTQQGAADPRLARPEVALGIVRHLRMVIWAGLGLLVLALAWWGIVGKLTLPPVIIGGVGVLGVIAWIVYNLRALHAAAGTRAAKLVLNSAGFILFVLGILVCVNVIVARHHPRADLTKNKVHSLAQQSMAVLKGLNQDVEMIAFLGQESGQPNTGRELIKLYETLSPKIKVKWADFTDVALAKQYEITFPGTVVVKAGAEPKVKQEKVTDINESRMTSAILSVTTETKTVVYFLTGHGEASMAGGGENGIATLKSDLDNQQYVAKDLDLAKMAKPEVPGDCGVLAVIGAKQAPTAQEMAAIEKWVDNKGKLLLALSPPPGPDFASILSKRGVTVLAGAVVDPEASFLGQELVPQVTPKPGSPVLEGVSRVILPFARAMKVESSTPPPSMPGQPPPPPSGPATAILESSASAWLLPKVEGQSGAPQKPADAQMGPFAMAATIDEGGQAQPPAMPGAPPPPEEDGTRIVVLGSDLALNDAIVSRFKFNGYLALNSVAWLSKNVRLISIPPKTEAANSLLLTSTQKNFIIFVVLVFIPLGLIVAGVSVWWTRRR